MKVGIITFQRVDNFGSMLQAYALSKYLEKLGQEVAIIDYIYPQDMKQYRIFRTHIYKKRPQTLLGDLVYIRRNISRKKSFAHFRDSCLNFTQNTYVYGSDKIKETNHNFDAFICGSDQIWNTNCTQTVVPEYFLEFVEDNKLKVAYAPSMPCEIKESEYLAVKKFVSRLDYISVRENYTVDFLRKKIGVSNSIICTVDPTLLLEADEYIKDFSITEKQEKYIFVYILGNKEVKNDIIKNVLFIKKRTGFSIKYVYIRKISEFEKAEYIYGIGPEEFLDYVYNASYIITDSFHATVFSLMFKKSFFVFPRNDSEIRVKELLENLGMSERYIDGNELPEMDLVYPANFDNKLQNMISNSKSFLNRIFNSK